MKLRELTDEELLVMQRNCDEAFERFIHTRSLSSRGPHECFRAGFNACLTDQKILLIREPKGEPMNE